MPSHQYSLIASQPQARTDLAASDLVSLTEKAAHPIHAPHAHTHEADENACNQCDAPPSEHRGCHNATLRRLFLPAIIALLLLGGLLAYGCASGHGAPAWMDGLVRRAVGDGTSSSGTGGPFVNRKLYLVVIFVGLLVVVILAVMLSAWCCKGAFSNPLCCPCYLCACCGGLACLECIGCGLCAEGVDQM